MLFTDPSKTWSNKLIWAVGGPSIGMCWLNQIVYFQEQAAARLKKDIKQQDPNCVKKKVSTEAQKRIKKRLLETTKSKYLFENI
jgi:hypothetical protein